MKAIEVEKEARVNVEKEEDSSNTICQKLDALLSSKTQTLTEKLFDSFAISF
jgi:hypothetical protein